MLFVCSRYLDSCTGPALKRKSESHSLATSSSSSSTSEDDKPAGATDTAQANSDGINRHTRSHTLLSPFRFKFVVFFAKAISAVLHVVSPLCPVVVLNGEVSVGTTAAAVVGAPLTDITMSTKAMSVVSVTSQCSYSSTIVHVPQPESGTQTCFFIVRCSFATVDLTFE